MEKFFGWLMILAIGFIAVMTPILMIACPLAGVKISVGLYVMGFIELACILIYIGFRIFDRKAKPGELKKMMIPTSVAACAVAFVLGISLTPLYEFEGDKKSSYSSSSSTSSWSHSSTGTRKSSSSSGYSGGTSRTNSYQTTAKPKSSYTGYSGSGRSTTRSKRTVDPMDHDIDIYYEDYKDEFVDEDDAWDDFEDDDSVWDDY